MEQSHDLGISSRKPDEAVIRDTLKTSEIHFTLVPCNVYSGTNKERLVAKEKSFCIMIATQLYGTLSRALR